MAVYKDFSTGTMIHLTGAWIDVGRTRPLLEKMKRVAPLLDDIESVHAELVRTHRKETAAEDAIRAIQAEQLDEDRTHDGKARGSFDVLTAFAAIADTAEQAAPYEQAIAILFPDGMRILTATYSDEAGRCKLSRGRLSPEIKATLKSIPSPDGTLLRTVMAWLDAGDALGALEERRAKLEAASARSKETSGAGNALRARNHWIGVVRAVVDMIELEAPQATVRDEVLGPLERALAQAARRSATARAGAGSAPAGDGGSATTSAAADTATPAAPADPS